MAKAPPITDDQLLAAISAAEETALGTLQGAISSDRADAIDRYYGKPYTGDAILQAQGRSTIISRDVADVVEGVVANVVKPFVGGDQVVVFDPIGPDDEKQAEQETDYVNFIALQRNNGFVWMVSAIKDALLLRNGYVKCHWTVRQDVVTETYSGLSDEEMGLMMQGNEVEVVQHSGYPDPSYMPPPPEQMQQMAMQAQQAGQPFEPPPPPMLHDVKVRRSRPTEYVEICPVPPDEILVSERARGPSLQDVDFVQHRTRKTLSELRQAGYKVDDDISDDDKGESIEDIARQRFGEGGDMYDDDTGNAARRIVMYKETHIRIDRDGDGVAELRRVCSVGLNLLADDECDIVGIGAGTGILMPHQHLGMSAYDLVEDIAKIKTNLLRSYLDNRNQINNTRTAVDESRANVDDFLVSRPGGVVRGSGNPNEWMMPIVTPDTSTGALQGLEYLDTIRENRTGYTRNSAGMDNDALTNTTATGMSMQLSQSQLRLEMIARSIAETLLRDVFKIVHALTLKHSSKADKVRLNGTWAEVNPREWSRRSDLSITIGLGSGTSEQQLGKLMALGPLMQQGQSMGLVGVEEGYNYATEAFKLSGYKATQRFIKAPEVDPQTGQPKQPPPPPPPPQVQVAQIQQQGEQAKLQATQQADVQKFHATQQAEQQRMADQAQLERDKLQMEAAVKQQEQQAAMQVQASNDQRDNQKAALEHERELQRMAMDDAFRRDQMMLQAQLKREEMANNSNTQKTIAKASGVDVDSEDKMTQLITAMNSPKRVIRDESGRVVGLQSVQ